jgi:type II secretory pathway pseudopilin PulG
MAYAKTAFTIIELLTIMSIIIIIIGVLLPTLSTINWYAKYTTQRNQFRNIEAGLQAYENDFGEYPDSSEFDTTGAPYNGAMKLAEAMAGQDGLGFNPDSKFTACDSTGTLYPRPAPPLTDPTYIENLKKRKEYTETKDVPLGSPTQLFATTGAFTCPDKVSLICDVYKRSELRDSKGNKLGMPILYYRANTINLLHDANFPDTSIYNYKDNMDLINLGVKWNPTIIHPLDQGTVPGQIFYDEILDTSALPIQRPHNKNGYILISAGGDGIYGNGTGGSLRTRDVVNFSD